MHEINTGLRWIDMRTTAKHCDFQLKNHFTLSHNLLWLKQTWSIVRSTWVFLPKIVILEYRENVRVLPLQSLHWMRRTFQKKIFLSLRTNGSLRGCNNSSHSLSIEFLYLDLLSLWKIGLKLVIKVVFIFYVCPLSPTITTSDRQSALSNWSDPPPSNADCQELSGGIPPTTSPSWNTRAAQMIQGRRVAFLHLLWTLCHGLIRQMWWR